jgi:hypothetical protein
MVASFKRAGIGSFEWTYIAKNLREAFVKWPFMIMLLFAFIQLQSKIKISSSVSTLYDTMFHNLALF